MRKFCRRATLVEFDGPISTGPPTPPRIRLTRRRISARMMRSPRSAAMPDGEATTLGEERLSNPFLDDGNLGIADCDPSDIPPG